MRSPLWVEMYSKALEFVSVFLMLELQTSL